MKLMNNICIFLFLFSSMFSVIASETKQSQDKQKQVSKPVNVIEAFNEAYIFSWHTYWQKHGKPEAEALKLIGEDLKIKVTPEMLQVVLKKAADGKWEPQDVEALMMLQASQISNQFPIKGIDELSKAIEWIQKYTPQRKDLIAQIYSKLSECYLRLTDNFMSSKALSKAILNKDDDYYHLGRAADRMYLFDEKGCEDDLNLVRNRSPDSKDLKIFEQKISEWRKKRDARKAKEKEFDVPVENLIELFTNKKITAGKFLLQLLPKYKFYIVYEEVKEKDDSENLVNFLSYNVDNLYHWGLFSKKDLAENQLKLNSNYKIREVQLYNLLQLNSCKRVIIFSKNTDGGFLISEKVIQELRDNFIDIVKASGIHVESSVL